jgi:hypothetical protein
MRSSRFGSIAVGVFQLRTHKVELTIFGVTDPQAAAEAQLTRV